MADLFGDDDNDPEKAKKARDAALRRIRERGGDWRDRAMAALVLIDGFTGTAEDIRIRLLMKGLDKPHHHNAWGEFSKAAIKLKRFLPTGQRRHMRTTKSHARLTPVYTVKWNPHKGEDR
jgi:hypothetical protein